MNQRRIKQTGRFSLVLRDLPQGLVEGPKDRQNTAGVALRLPQHLFGLRRLSDGQKVLETRLSRSDGVLQSDSPFNAERLVQLTHSAGIRGSHPGKGIVYHAGQIAPAGRCQTLRRNSAIRHEPLEDLLCSLLQLF